MPEYIAYFPWADAAYVLTADPKRFPRRADKYQAAQDARDHWHREGEHLIPWRINDDGSVTALDARVRRVVEVMG